MWACRLHVRRGVRGRHEKLMRWQTRATCGARAPDLVTWCAVRCCGGRKTARGAAVKPRQTKHPHCSRRYQLPLLGVLGSIPDSAVRAAEAAGATADSALWHDLTELLAAGLHGSIPAQLQHPSAGAPRRRLLRSSAPAARRCRVTPPPSIPQTTSSFWNGPVPFF